MRFYGASMPTQAYANGTGNTSVALGNGALAGSLGNRNTALVVGNGSNAFSYGGSLVPAPSQISDYKPSNGNTSVAIGNGSEAGPSACATRLSTAVNGHQRENNGLRGLPQN